MAGAEPATRRPTIRDVAARAGVSKSLVSLALAGSTGVSEARRRRILAAAAELGYRPNVVARSLAASGPGMIGVLLADLHNPLFADIVDAARIELQQAGHYGLLTGALLPTAGGEATLDSAVVAAVRDLGARGLLVVGSVPDMAALADVAAGLPVIVASASPGDLPVAGVVRNDDHAGIELVVDHLTGLGHRDVAFVGRRGGTVSRLRHDAYVDAMGRRGLSGRTADSDYTEEGGYRGAQRLLTAPTRPTAIAAVNDLAAVGVLSAVADAGLRIPQDVSVTGYDNTSLSRIRALSLTTVDPGNSEIGRQAVRRLLAADSAEPPAATEVLVRPTLVVRDSTAPPRQEAP